MATAQTRRRLSFIDFTKPKLWQQILEYSDTTITLSKLTSQLHQLVNDYRRRTEQEIRGKCSIGGSLYDLWESLLLESELESQSLKKLACSMEKNICASLERFISVQTHQFSLDKSHYEDLNEIVDTSREIVHQTRKSYARIYEDQGVTVETHLAHNEYLIELTGINGLLSKYYYQIMPQVLQAMETTQINTIDTICRSIESFASIIEEYHDQRHSSLASFVLTSRSANPSEELDNYMCSISDSSETTSAGFLSIRMEPFSSPMNNLVQDRLFVYSAPSIQNQLRSLSKESLERLKELKRDKNQLISTINLKTTAKVTDDAQQSEKKILQQMSDLMKKKHQLRLIELEETVIGSQHELLKKMENENDGEKRSTKNIKGLWRDAVRALKTPSTGNESHSSFVRRLSSRKKKHHDRQEDPTVIDPVYETLKIAAETRKRTIATYLQQRQQTLNKQMSLNSQGSSEVEIQPSPRIPRHPTPVDPSPRIRRQNARTETELARAASDLASLPNPNANI